MNILLIFNVSNVERMLTSFGTKDTKRIWQGYRIRNLPGTIQQFGRRKLRMLHNAQDLNDLRIPPSNRLEKLAGRYKGFHSIRINRQWRIIFKWHKGNASEVQILDYH